MKIKSIKPYDGPTDENGKVSVYDITVAGTHNYCAGNILVSNSKRVSLLGLSALLSHSVPSVIKDAKQIRGQKNDQFWLSYMSGFNPPAPEVPMVYRKFVNELKGSGINVVEDGPSTHFMAMTDKDIDKLAGDRVLQNADTVDQVRGLKELPGGLFSRESTGGHSGCFVGSVQVWTDQGMLRISDIVTQRLAVKVWSYNFERQEFELKPVTGWFRNYSAEGVGQARFSSPGHPGLSRIGGSNNFYPRTLAGTRGHQVYDRQGNKQELASAKSLVFLEEELTYTQSQLLFGSMLGDAHVTPKGSLSFSHSVKQENYIKFKRAILAPVVTANMRENIQTIGGKKHRILRFVTRCHSAFRATRELCYVGIRKTICREWLDKVDEMGLAFWYLDDGCSYIDASGTRTLTICTECFSYSEIEELATWLSDRWGLSTYKSRNNKLYGDRDCGWKIRLTGFAAEDFLDLIAPYVPGDMQYKLGKLPPAQKCTCGRSVTRPHKICNTCFLAEPFEPGTNRVRNGARDRFGGTVVVRELVATGVIPEEPICEKLRRHETRFSIAGCATDSMLQDIQTKLILTTRPIDFVWEDRADWLKTSTTVYDIEVADNHNYFANGVLVSNSKWSKIPLHEKMPSPVMEEPIRRLLGLTEQKFRDILAGKEELNGFKGPDAIHKALSKIDVDRELLQAREAIKGGRKTARDTAVRKLGYLKSAKELGTHPSEWMLSSVPVIPPVFRPISMMSDTGMPLVSDANYLYSELWNANDNLKAMSTEVEDLGEERMALYDAFKAVTGLGAPVHPKLVEKNITGFLGKIVGTSPKHSVVHRKLIGNTADLVGRGVVSPDKNMDMDSIGLPEDVAWEIFRPMVARSLKRRGMQLTTVLDEIENRSKLAKSVLLEEMDKRPVIAVRDPVLHKFGVMAFKPRLVSGSTIRTSPLIVGGFGMDYDGNCVSYDTPIVINLELDLLYSSELGQDFLENLFSKLDKDLNLRYDSEALDISCFSFPESQMIERSTLVAVGTKLTMPIGKLPRVGQPAKDKNGADVYPVPDGVTICSYDHATGAVGQYPVTGLTVEQDCPCCLVTTARGREVECSTNESLAVLNADTLELEKTTPMDARGRLVPFVYKEPITGNDYSRELGWWYGSFVGDGWISDDVVGYCKLEKEKRDRFLEIAKTICPYFDVTEHVENKEDHPGKFGNSVKIHLLGKKLPPFIFNCFDRQGEGRSALYKRLPAELLATGSRECLLGLLTGLIDGDGCVTWNTVRNKPRAVCRSHTSSRGLVQDMIHLGRLLGVRCSVTVMPAKGMSQEAYVICWSVIDIGKIIHELDFVGEHEQKWAEEFKAAIPTKDNMDIVPISSALVDSITKVVTNAKYSTLYSIIRRGKSTGTLGRASALRAIAIVGDTPVDCPEYDKFLRIVLNTDIHWDTVTSVIKTGSQEVFDLIIPDTKVFMINNGLIIYDTMNLHAVVSPDAVEAAYERMLPSKNLLSPGDFKTPVHGLKNEMVGGLYHMSTANSGKRPHTFATTKDALKAIRSGEVDLSDPIEILND